ncbi:hypothetical protein [Halalkalibacter krulwichiae]|uniref:hypothetical protein n=1 Tax=Halalkalibacter krulwichiae TaxID=199441 RepID=UPI0012ECBE73|nr:hypothetical protein [Halalkalibacter krulwichiae]
MKNKVVLLAAILLIVVAAVIRFNQIQENHEANKVIAENCIDNEGTVIIQEGLFFTLTSVTCEEGL